VGSPRGQQTNEQHNCRGILEPVHVEDRSDVNLRL
jgi:hypothetical protein